MKQKKTRNGDVFTVRYEGADVGRVLVTRGGARPILLGYFFGTESFLDLEGSFSKTIRREDALLISRFSYLGIKMGDWPYLGSLKGFSESDWPMPLFFHYEKLRSIYRITQYDEDRLEERLSITYYDTMPCGDGRVYVEDSLRGYESVAGALEMIISGERQSTDYIFS